MNKYDWLEVITRGIGIWFIASGAVAVLGAMTLGGPVAAKGLVMALGTSFLGTVFVLLAPGFIGWLRQKDEAVREGAVSRSESASTEASS